MANQSYQSTWTGAIPGNQPQIPQNQNNQMMYNQPQPQNGPPVENMVPWGWPMGPMPQNNNSNLFIAIAQSQEAVDNYPVGRGITAFLVNYPEGVFWTKRLKDDGLGYDTVKHHFCTDAEWEAMKSPMITNNSVSAEEFEKLQKDLAQLRVEFEDFIK